jgi:hypothetical protein
MEARAGIRTEVLHHLELLASPDLQVRYEHDVKMANVPAELVCVWFDDLNLPASAPELFAGGNVELVQGFSALLEKTAKELDGLALSELHAHPAWLKVVAEARGLLQRLRDAV